MDEKLTRIASVLNGLAPDHRAALINELQPPTHVIVAAQCDAEIEAAFRLTAARIHDGLKVELKFDPRTFQSCWASLLKAAEPLGR